MITYAPTAADRAPLPTAFAAEPRYLGYREPERALPFAHFFRDEAQPMQDHVREALLGGKAPSEYGYDIADAARRLARPGYPRLVPSPAPCRVQRHAVGRRIYGPLGFECNSRRRTNHMIRRRRPGGTTGIPPL